MDEELAKRLIPLRFEALEDIEDDDTRFIKVKIWLMHIGKNDNKSFFSKSVVEEATPTLAYTPILGFIKDVKNGKDFDTHKEALVLEDGEFKLKYMGQAYGVIPADCNPQFEDRVGDDGVTRTYLTCEGLIWTKFSDAVDILEASDSKNQSMELSDEYEGYWDKDGDGLYHFTKFQFYGACILGDDVPPAMNSASIELNFAKNLDSKLIQDKLQQFKLACEKRFSLNNEDVNQYKEVQTQMDFAELLAKYSITEDVLASEHGIVVTDFASQKDLESKLDQILGNVTNNGVDNASVDDQSADTSDASTSFAKDDTQVAGDTPTEDTTPTVDNPASTFALTGNQLVDELRRQIKGFKETDKWGYQSQCFYFTDYLPDENIVVVYDYDDSWYLGLPYTVDGNTVTVDFHAGVRYISQWVKLTPEVKDPESDGSVEGDTDGDDDVVITTMSKEFHDYAISMTEKDVTTKFSNINNVIKELEDIKTQFSTVSAERDELKTFKETSERQAHEDKANALFTTFSKHLTDEDVADLKENLHNFSLDSLEEKLWARKGKKEATQFSQQEEETPLAKFSFAQPSNEGDDSKPVYAHILEKHAPKRPY